jgi:polyisoprenoid-binding protein YceI
MIDMKKSQFFKSLLVAAFATALTTSALFAADVRYQAQPRGSSVKIAGTSTVHDWVVESTLIGGFMEIAADAPLDPATDGQSPEVKAKVDVKIPVRSIKSGTKRMDEVMHAAMNEPRNKMISYKLMKLTAKDAARKAGDPFGYTAKGRLTVNGVTKIIEMPVHISKSSSDAIKVTGQAKVKMTDFAISPPSPKMALGLIKTGDDVDITFEWLTKEKKK